MFDIGASELLVIVIVAVLVIGPKDMPLALRTAGRWIGKIRRVSTHFRTGVDAMIREAELEELEKKWQAQNEAIMAKTGNQSEMDEDQMIGPPAASAEAAEREYPTEDDPPPTTGNEPQLPLDNPKKRD